MHPSQSLRQGCGRDRKTHNVKAATFARSAGGKPEYQQVYSSALYGRDAMKDFDDYIRSESACPLSVRPLYSFLVPLDLSSEGLLRTAADHRMAVKKGEDPLTRVAWPPAADDASTTEIPPHSYRQTQRQNNQQALHELDSWADAHDVGTQKWLARWQRRQHDELAALELWDRLATPAAHNQQPKIRKQTKEGDAADSKARAEARAWASAAAAPAPAALSKPLNSGARAGVSAVASGEAASNASALAMSMPPAVRRAVTGSRVALLESLGDDSVVPLSALWVSLKALLLRTELAAEDLLVAKTAVEGRELEELVDAGEFVLELMALIEEGAP